MSRDLSAGAHSGHNSKLSRRVDLKDELLIPTLTIPELYVTQPVVEVFSSDLKKYSKILS
jgi:hypothetical protein